jgi:transcriptional regulator with XRE-family HTH domain
MRIAFKLAILASGKSQRQLAVETGIPESRMSELVRGWKSPSEAETSLLTTALQRPAAVLFASSDEQRETRCL